MTAAVSLTEAERDAMAHAIGHHSAKGCSRSGGRNHYVTDAADDMWSSLVNRGLATVRRSSVVPEGTAIFHVTPAGIAAVEADPRSQRPKPKGRGYIVRFKGGDSVSVCAETRGKAKYKAIDGLLDVMSAKDAFLAIESCRLGLSS